MSRSTLWAVASGLLLALASAGVEWSALAWIGLVPLFEAIAPESPRRSFVLGWIAGLVYHLATLHWVAVPVARYTSVPAPAAALVAALLCAWLSLYLGAFAAGMRFWERRTRRDSLFFAVVSWVALEWVRAAWLFPLPWNLLGHSQYRNTTVIQLAELTGIYGPGALIVAVNYVLHSIFFRREIEARRSVLRLGSVTLLLVAVLAGGAWRRAEVRGRPAAGRLTVGIVQPAIDPRRKWDSAARAGVLAEQEALSRVVARQGARLVVWPEASAPFVFADDSFYARDPAAFAEERSLRDRMLRFTREVGAPLLFGAPAISVETTGRGEVWNSLNRVWLVSRAGGAADRYDKTILVPFGEYVPFRRLLFFVEKLVPGVGEFVPGAEASLFSIREGRFAVLVCYEAIFPDFVRRRVADGADFLVNVTNDAWFGRTLGPRQHLAMAAVRAIENRRPLVRAANTGVSAIVDPDGTIRFETPLFERATRTAEVRWSRRLTFYSRYGDVFAAAASLAALVMLGYAMFGTAAPEGGVLRLGAE